MLRTANVKQQNYTQMLLRRHLRKFHAVYAKSLRRCVRTSNLTIAQAIHAKLVKAPLIVDSLFTNNHLINAYVKCGDISDGVQLFGEMRERNVVSWTALISGYAQKGEPVEAFYLFSRMHRRGVVPTEFSFVSALHACSFTESLSLVCALQVCSLIVKIGFGRNVYLLNVFLTVLIRHRLLDEAVAMFEEFPCKDIVSWNAIFGGYMKFRGGHLPRLWLRMISEGMVPDAFCFTNVLTGMADLSNYGMGLRVHAHLVKSGHGREKCVGNALVHMYLKCQRFVDGYRAFEEIPVKDVYSWTQMAQGWLNYGKANEALRVIEEMRKAGVMPDKLTLVTGLSACASLASLEEGKKVQGLVIKLGDDIDLCVYNALLDMYAKCGYMDSALRVFKSMSERSVVSWTTMIMGYAQSGRSKEALEMFEKMKSENVQPNHITFICVLYACGLEGCVDSGWKYFNSMSQEYGIVPQEDHYACMVNLFGRIGLIKEAEDLISGMPMKPGVVIWQTLLGACRLHGDVETAKRAAEHVLALDNNDSSTYMLLSHAFADNESWGSVGMMRQLIQNNRDIKKNPGSSWLEMGS